MKRKLLLTLTLATVLIGAGCDMPDANFCNVGNATIVKISKYGNDNSKANFTIETGLSGYNRTVTLFLPVGFGRVGDRVIYTNNFLMAVSIQPKLED